MTAPRTFEPAGRVALVTGAARGIGAALATALVAGGARAVALCDIDAAAATHLATRIGAHPYCLDVTDEAAVAATVARVEAAHGGIDLYCSNAGILQLDSPDWSVFARPSSDWQRAWEVNVLAHLHACRAVLPGMLARGGGTVLLSVSAAGLLAQIGAAAYTTTKHAALGFAESLAIAHGDDGIYAAALCPQGVATDMLRDAGDSAATLDGVLSAEAVATHTLAALARGEFLIRPHPQVADYARAKADDPERWLGGMRKLRRRQLARTGRPV